MRLLIDADAFSKLAHWNLLEELHDLARIPLKDCVTLESVLYRARRAATGESDKLFRTREVAAAAIVLLRSMSPPPVPPTSLLSRFQDIAGIDAGEAILLTLLDGDKEAVLLTGDKRALRALAGLPQHIREGLSGRIMTIEQLVLAALNTHGLDWVRAHLCALRDIDKTIGIVLGSRCQASEGEVRAGLSAYIEELAKLCDPSLLISESRPVDEGTHGANGSDQSENDSNGRKR